MERRGWDASLTRYAEGWRATFIRRDYTTRAWVGQVLTFHRSPARGVVGTVHGHTRFVYSGVAP